MPLRFLSIAAAVVLIIGVTSSATRAQSVAVGADQRSDLALTVYQGGFALVHDVRRANLLNDTTTVIIPDLSRAILLFVRGSGKRRWLIWGLAISFSMWQCAGHGNAFGTGWRH